MPKPATITVTVSASGDVTEGDGAVFTVSASPSPVSDLMVYVTVSETGDHATGGLGRRTVTVASGQTSATFTVGTVDDSTDEADGQVTAVLESGSGYTVGSPSRGSVAIEDNDPTPAKHSVTIHNDSRHTITEGQPATFKVEASPAPTTNLRVRINVTEKGHFAERGQLGARTVTISAGSNSATLSVSTVNDTTDEPHARISAALVDDPDYTVGSPPSLVLVKDDDDPPPAAKSTLTIKARRSSVTEGTVVEFDVTAKPKPRLTLTVWFTVTESQDCTATSQVGKRGVYLYGNRSTATLKVFTVDDSEDEPDCTVKATITAGTDYTVGSPSNATTTVADNDATPAKPIVRVSGSSYAVTEGQTVTFTISASPAPKSSMTVDYYLQDKGGVTSGGSGYGTVTFPAGATSATVTVITVDDSTDQEADDLYRPSRSVALSIQESTDYTRHGVYVDRVYVNDND